MKRGWRRAGAASATVAAGALVFVATGTGHASAASKGGLLSGDCKLGTLLCGVLGTVGVGGSTATPPASPSGGGTSKAPAAPAKPAPEPKPAPAHRSRPVQAEHRAPASSAPARRGDAAPVARAPSQVAIPQQSGPALPDVVPQDPLVMPEAAGPPPSGRAELVAASDTVAEPMPPLLIATASGLVGAVAALNISMLRQRRRGLPLR
jgi:hypothetical protein